MRSSHFPFRHVFVGFVFAALWCGAQPLAPDALETRLQALVNAPPLDKALVGIRVVEAGTGRVAFDYHGNVGFTPASNTKLFSGAFALSKLGAAYRFQTSVLAAVEPEAGGLVHGDVTLLAGGDPTLSGRAYPYESCRNPREGDAVLKDLAAQMASHGVNRIQGDIVGDDTRYPLEPYGAEWTVEDAGGGGEAPVSAWMLNDNVSGADERPFRDPALEVATRFRQVLLDEGITVTGQARARHRQPDGAIWTMTGSAELASHASPPLGQILQTMEKCSVNLHAESLLLEAAFQARQELRSRAKALEEERTFIVSRGVPSNQFELHDGSGLSRANLVTPAAITALLLSIQTAPWREPFLAALPVGGVDGTLERRFGGDPAARAIRAKTGTLRHVAALSGYAGDRYVFSILVNNFYPSAHKDVVRAIDTIALEIVKAAE